MNAENYIRKYKGSTAKMFCFACQLPTGSPAWLVARYYALGKAEKALNDIKSNNIAMWLLNYAENKKEA